MRRAVDWLIAAVVLGVQIGFVIAVVAFIATTVLFTKNCRPNGQLTHDVAYATLTCDRPKLGEQP